MQLSFNRAQNEMHKENKSISNSYTIGTVEVFCDTVCQEQLAQFMCLSSCDITGGCVNQSRVRSSTSFTY